MSFPAYEDYKDSGVEWLGEVPEHWSVGQSRRIFALRNERANPDDEQLTASQEHGVIPQKMFMELEGRRVVQVILNAEILKHVEPGDFVISMRSFQGGIEYATHRGCISSAYVMLIPSPKVHGPFFKHLLKSQTYIQALQSTTNLIRDGQALRYQNFTMVDLPLVPPDEQTAIASFLDTETSKIDSLVSEQRRLIELLKEKRQAVISHAVTKGLNPGVPMKPSGIQWLGDVPEHWEVKRVKTVSNFVTSGPRGWSERIADGGSLFIQSGDLNDALGIEFSNSKRVQVDDDAETTRTQLFDGDVVVCVTGAKTGKVAVCTNVPEVAYVNQHLCLVRPNDKVLPRFLGILLKSEIGLTYFDFSQYGLKQGLSLEDVKNAPVFVPPREEQNEIVEYVDTQATTFDTLQAEAERAIELLQERRTALISAAVTGKIDVREFATGAVA